ncbi:hypothetical protein LTR27_007436 [Elasticomyces elasticus]|nr:hypothetical protein LTR27_007436 [Elasticomyces elasticus]
MEIQGLVPTIAYPNTKTEAINVDEYEPSSLPVPPPQAIRPEVSFASARYTGNGAKRIKIESDTSEKDAGVGAMVERSRLSNDTDINEDEVEPLADVKCEIIDIDSDDWSDLDSSDCDDEQTDGPSHTTRESTFGDDAAYGRTPQPRPPHNEHSVSTPQSHEPGSNDQATDHCAAPSQSAWLPAPDDNLVSLFKSPPQAAPAPPAAARPAEGATPSLSPSSNEAGRGELLARLQYLRRQQEIADIEAQLSKS